MTRRIRSSAVAGALCASSALLLASPSVAGSPFSTRAVSAHWYDLSCNVTLRSADSEGGWGERLAHGSTIVASEQTIWAVFTVMHSRASANPPPVHDIAASYFAAVDGSRIFNFETGDFSAFSAGGARILHQRTFALKPGPNQIRLYGVVDLADKSNDSDRGNNTCETIVNVTFAPVS